MIMRLVALLLLAAVFATTSSIMFSALAAETESEALAVWDHHLEGARTRNLDLFMEDFADDATVILDNGVYVGKAAIRAIAAQYLQAMPADVGDIVIKGNPQFSDRGLIWPFELNGRQAIDSVYVVDGKIVFLSEISSPIPSNLLPPH
jgi:hypothetical protein